MSKNEDKPQINLPFSTQKIDVGEWAYDHRMGLMFTFVVAVIFVLLTLYITITVQNTTYYDAILIDMHDEIIEEQEEVKQEIKQEQTIEYEKVSNLSSNENAQSLNDQLTDSKNTPAKEIYQEIEAMERKAQLNKQLYEQGLAEQAAILERGKSSELTDIKSSDVKVEGMVTVSFSFVNPIRKSLNLTVPAYMCEGGGMVVLDVWLDNSGKVLDAKANKKTTTQDNCMIQTAENAAKSSRFELNANAPVRHYGTITYIFIPQ